MRVEVVIPHDCTEDVIGNLASRRGVIGSQEARDGMQTVQARVPLSEMFGYATDLRSRTRGRGAYVMQFEHYQPFRPADNNDDSLDSLVGVPRRPTPTLRESSVALPEPDEQRPVD
jgi:translation elongation factor EF-G